MRKAPLERGDKNPWGQAHRHQPTFKSCCWELFLLLSKNLCLTYSLVSMNLIPLGHGTRTWNSPNYGSEGATTPWCIVSWGFLSWRDIRFCQKLFLCVCWDDYIVFVFCLWAESHLLICTCWANSAFWEWSLLDRSKLTFWCAVVFSLLVFLFRIFASVFIRDTGL